MFQPPMTEPRTSRNCSVLVWPCLASLVLLLGAMCPAMPIAAAEPRSKEVQALLEELPMWPMRPFVEDDGEQERRAAAARFEAIAGRLDDYNLDEIRAGLALYTESPAYRPELAFVAIQYVFEVPKRVDPLFKHVRPSFSVMGTSLNELPESWPWRKAKNGKMTFEILSIGLVRNGPPYPALEVFDTYRKHFPRRERK